MGLLSRLVKNVKRAVRKVAPIVATAAPFVPQLAPFAGVARAVSGRVGVPSTPFLRGDIPVATPPIFPGQPTISAAENRSIDAAIALAEAALRRGPIAGPSPAIIPRERLPQVVPQPGVGVIRGGVGMAGLGGVIGRVGAGLGFGGAAAGGALVRTAGTAILSQGGRIIGFITSAGTRISRKRAVALAKSLGLQAAAAGLGVGIVELATAVAEETGRPRRRRGITARDFSTTRRTLTKIKRMHDDLPRRSVRTRKAPC